MDPLATFLTHATFEASEHQAQTGGAASGCLVGQNVIHAKFGAGEIVDAKCQGKDARVPVNVGRQDLEWQAVSVTKLLAA